MKFSEVEKKEIGSACASRLRELDKAFKTCIKSEAVDAAEKVTQKITVVRTLAKRIAEED